MTWADAILVASGQTGYTSGTQISSNIYVNDIYNNAGSVLAVPCSESSCPVPVITANMLIPLTYSEGFLQTKFYAVVPSGSVTATYIANGSNNVTTVYTVQ